MSLKIPDYNKFIANAKPVINKPTKGKGKLARAQKVPTFIMPPCNTNIILSSLKKEPIKKKKLARGAVPPPVQYNLVTSYNVGGLNRIVVCGDRNDPTTKEFQQYSCGSCWAYSIATAISDSFVVKYNYEKSPDLSWTYLLACYPNATNKLPTDTGIFPSAQCGGGDVSSVMRWLEKNGISTNVCVDYSWCLNSSDCMGAGGDPNVMNQQIPNCGCYRSGTFLKYLIQNVTRMSLEETEADDFAKVVALRNMIKNNIFRVGPVI
jgi:hypothetical protein